MDLLDRKIAQNENVISHMKDLQNKLKVSRGVLLNLYVVYRLHLLNYLCVFFFYCLIWSAANWSFLKRPLPRCMICIVS